MPSTLCWQLPQLPFPPKLIKLPSTVDRFSNYHHTSLVQKTMYPLMTNWDLGMPVESPELGLFDVAAGMDRPQPAGTLLDPKDQALLVKPMGISGSNGHADGRKSSTGLLNAGSPRSRPNVPWLRRTEYMSLEMGRNSLHKAPSHSKGGQSTEANIRALDCSREAQLEIIDASFKKAVQLDLTKLKHPSKPHLKAVDSIPLLPSHVGHKTIDAMASDAYTHCVLEQPPGAQPNVDNYSSSNSMAIRKAKEAIFKPMENERSGEKYLACFLPTETTVKHIEEGEDALDKMSLDYNLARDYSYEATPTEGGRQVMLFIRPGEYAGYAQLPTKLVLRRRRRLGNDNEMDRPQTMVVEINDKN
ncbi:RNA polymerase II-associated [Syncephalis fuscata]|nr:RNA polymerase II-associated [Syncephalis fuscata]